MSIHEAHPVKSVKQTIDLPPTVMINNWSTLMFRNIYSN